MRRQRIGGIHEAMGTARKMAGPRVLDARIEIEGKPAKDLRLRPNLKR